MIYHQKHLNESKKYAINKEGFDKDFYLSMLLHTSDISNLCREFVIAEQWGIRINQEMAEQWKLEKSAGITESYRGELSTAHHQSKFIEFILPYFEIISEIQPCFTQWLEELKKNHAIWTSMAI